jgi:hypothetical protein
MIGLCELLQKRLSAACADCNPDRIGDLCPMGVKVHPHPDLELVDPQPTWLRAALGHGLYNVVGSSFDKAPIAQADPNYVLAAVCLGGDDRGYAVGVVYLETNPIPLNELPDRDHSLRSRNQCVIWLARAALWALLEADVKPNGRVERRHLVKEDVGQLVLEGLGVLVAGEVASLAPPGGDRSGDAADHLLDRLLARGMA